MTETTTSADGTTIAFERAGAGPAVIVVGGAMNHRHSDGGLVPLLAHRFTVVTYDRRGRGDSGDTLPYAPAREIEDLTALIDAVGGSAMVFGHSSGAMLGLETAAAGASISKLAVYEPPYLSDPSRGATARTAAEGIRAALDAGDRAEAVAIFIRNTGAPFDPALKDAPWFGGLTALAHTLPYDMELVGDSSVPAERLARISVPTLGMYGGASGDWARNAIAAVTAAIPGASQVVVEGQTHAATPESRAPILIEFFSQA